MPKALRSRGITVASQMRGMNIYYIVTESPYEAQRANIVSIEAQTHNLPYKKAIWCHWTTRVGFEAFAASAVRLPCGVGTVRHNRLERGRPATPRPRAASFKAAGPPVRRAMMGMRDLRPSHSLV
nr:hypothetical protein Iba_chr01cCG3000 [Ipomoea batatas]GMC51095.1 hypothetical protein Iba_chr01cCG3010 [Ipomoea batatas]